MYLKRCEFQIIIAFEIDDWRNADARFAIAYDNIPTIPDKLPRISLNVYICIY